MLKAQLGHLHLGEIGLRGAGIVDRHQRAIEGGHRDVAGGGQHAIAGHAQDRDDRAHRDKGTENLGADGIFGQRHPVRTRVNAVSQYLAGEGLWRA